MSEIDFTKVAVGTFANLGGQPVDYAKSQVLDRAGVPPGDVLRVDLTYTHASAQGKAVPRLPHPFPPDVLPPGTALGTAQDYLDLIARTPPQFEPTAAEARADQQAANAEAQAAQAKAEEAQAEALQAEADAEAATRAAAETKAAVEHTAETSNEAGPSQTNPQEAVQQA